MHRITGILTTLGLFFIVAWLVLLMGSGVAFDYYHRFLVSWVGQVFLMSWSFAVFYHSFNGIRHLFWDAGIGFEKNQYTHSGQAVIALSSLFTLALWGLVYLNDLSGVAK